MAIVGFNFTKIVVEKNKASVGKIDITNNVSIKEVKEAKLNLGSTKKTGLEFNFIFTSRYNPDMGQIELQGKVVYMDKDEKIKDIMASWKKDKKVPKDILGPIYNSILSKCNIEAIILSREIQLPPPIPLPKLKAEN
ncbi:hypothetical protein JXB41_08390 [Candidatus Woesearchaeota archaeon]|nr:hypothetical protein [Candidatus Woesearchaeota archaeon]